jgi:polysaccharide pyruvyl transferase WcaK-like protein
MGIKDKSDHMLTVYIPEYIPAHNKGEEALLLGILKTLDGLNVGKVYLTSVSPEYDKRCYDHRVEVVPETIIPRARQSKLNKFIQVLKHVPGHLAYGCLRRISLRFARKLFSKGIYTVYNEMDFVLAAHDNSYAAMHNVFVLFCRFIGVPIAIYGTSIQSFVLQKKLMKRLFNLALERADLVTCRESISYDIIRNKLRINNPNVYLTADKAFIVDPEPKETGLEILRIHDVPGNGKPLIGLTVVHQTQVFRNSFQHIHDTGKRLNHHWSRIADLADHIIETTDGHIVILPHAIGPRRISDDRIAARGVFECCACKENISLIEKDYSVRELKAVIGCCDFFVGERTHSTIGAASMHVPFLSLTFSGDYRTWGILGRTLHMEEWIHDLGRDSLREITEHFDRAWSHRDMTRERLKSAIVEAKAKTMENRYHLEKMLIRKGLVSP